MKIHDILRRAVLDAVTGCITELYFKGSGTSRGELDDDTIEAPAERNP